MMSALRGLWRAVFGQPATPSLLRALIDAEAWAKSPADELERVAMLVRRSGLEHLVGAATRLEVDALARAGEAVADEHAMLVAAKLQDFAGALRPYDGGKAVENQVLDLMEARHAARCDAQSGGR